MIKLNNASLLQSHSLIEGKWESGEQGTSFPVLNPFNGETVATVFEMGEKEAKRAIEAANRAFPKWKALSPKERGDYLLKWEELIRTNWDDLSTLLTYEEGKPYEQSTHELMGCCSYLIWSAEEGKRLHGYTFLSPDPSRRFFTMRQPVGVVAAITPWNFPSVLPIQKCAPALAAGCTVVLKPAEDTPLSSLAHAFLAQEAGIPPGVFNVVACSNPKEVGNELLSNPLVRKFTFTGSTAVGKELMKQSAQTVKNVCLELGGNCPVLIFNDADLDRAAQETFWPKIYNAGQCCNNINRFLVQKEVYSSFIQKFQKMIDAHAKLGSGMDLTTSIGPLVNEQGMAKVEELIADALKGGAKIVSGGKRSSADSLLYPPTLLSHVTQEMRLYREEIFGPVAPIYSFTTEEEGIAMANDTPYGLASYFFTQDAARMWRVSEALEAGSVGVNTCDVVSEILPFGGWKESGIGREKGMTESLFSYCENKSLVIGGIIPN